MYDTIRFWTMSAADFLDEYFESEIVKAHFAGSSIIGTALGPRSPGTAYVLLHHYMGDIDDAVGAWGFRPGRHGSGDQGPRMHLLKLKAARSTSRFGGREASSTRNGRARWRRARRRRPSSRRSTRASPIMDVQAHLPGDTMDPKDLPGEFLKQVRQLQNPRLVGQAQHRARRPAAISRRSQSRCAMHARRHACHRHDRDDGARL